MVLESEVRGSFPVPTQYTRALSPSQRHYSAGQLETWAIIAATRKWSVYLNGAEKVMIHTDHSPLKWLQAQKDPKPTYARWLMELQGLQLEIAVRPGSENNVADYLSRNPSAEPDEEVNSEDTFENRIFLTVQTAVKQDAIKQLRREGLVFTGGLVGERLSVVNGKLLFKMWYPKQ